MWSCHGWDWWPPQTASRTILDMYNVYEHIDMLSIGIKYHPYTVIPTLLLGSDFGALGHLWSQNDMIMSWLRLTATSNCFPHPYWTCTKWLSTLICYPWAYSISLTQLYPHYLGQILELWVTCGVKMIRLCHDWGWQPPQTASHIPSRHITSIWAHRCAVLWYIVAALHSFTHPTWLRFWGTWSFVELKQCIFCHGWCWQPPQTTSHIHIRHIQNDWAHWYAINGHTVSPLHSYTHPTWLIFLGAGSLVESKWCDYVMVEADSHLNLLPTSILDMHKVFEHIDVLSIGIW